MIKDITDQQLRDELKRRAKECRATYINCGNCAHYNGGELAGTGICRATQERTSLTTRCFNKKFKPK